MINRLIDLALNQRFLVAVLTIGLIAYGWASMQKLNVDAFPDVTNVQVQINTEAPGLAAAEVEQLITYPVESVMNGLPDVTEVRSTSKTGLRSEEHTSALQSLMRISYADFCLKTKNNCDISK